MKDGLLGLDGKLSARLAKVKQRRTMKGGLLGLDGMLSARLAKVTQVF